MAHAARVHQQLRGGQGRHQRTGAGSVVEMDVGQHDPVDVFGCDARGRQGGEDPRHRRRCAGIDDGGAAAMDYEMDRRQAVTAVSGIDREHPVGMRGHVLHDETSKRGCARALLYILGSRAPRNTEFR